MKKSILLSSLLVAGLGVKAQTDSATIVNKVYSQVDQKAKFKGGNDAFSDFVNKNIVYPERSKRKRITGIITVAFVVGKDSTISMVKSATEVTKRNAELVNEAIRVIESTGNNWIPAMLNGQFVKSYCVVSITFDLD
jgi:protein TonB